MKKELELIEEDQYLEPFKVFFLEMRRQIQSTEKRLCGESNLSRFASAHEYYGLHRLENEWVFREWAPNANRAYLIGDFTDWRVKDEFSLAPIGNGDWEICFPLDTVSHQDLYRIYLEWPGGSRDRMPAYARCTFQDAGTAIFSAKVWEPENRYQWKEPGFKRPDQPLLIYETHVGMAQEEPKVGSFREFSESILPRVVKAGYNAIQIMAVQEHPYYASFGYQVSSFYAPSCRFGTPDDLRELIDAAHTRGLAVFLDLVHSHAVKNEIEGLSRFDGTTHLYFHDGERGRHPVWDSRLFNYGKPEVLRFLLSNIRYWVEEYKFDGFRFDGVTSMLYYDHGLREPFTSYASYFNNRIDRDALAYLALANKMAHELGPITTIAEDVSGLPGLAAPLEKGGFGFDYRLAMGIPDFWIKTVKTKRDEDWHVEEMFYELTNRRADEKTISYAESHDQALVGDQTLIFRLLKNTIYTSMRIEQFNHLVDRGLALHRLIRLATAAAAGHGYLNFMGNEFGHPEWIDFPRPGNNWSYHHARRLWSLRDNPELQFGRLAKFDEDMIALIKAFNLYRCGQPRRLTADSAAQTIAFTRGRLLFVFNFSPAKSVEDYRTPCPKGDYKLILDSDAVIYGGNGRICAPSVWRSEETRDEQHELRLYLPTRTALVLEKADSAD